MFRPRIRAVLPFLLALCGAAVTGCGGGGGGGDGGGGTAGTTSSALRVVVTDAPFSFGNVLSAKVEVQRIDLHRAGAGEETLQTLVTFSPARELDLVHLQNGVAETLYEGNPPPGDYDSVRLVVVPKEIVVDDAGTPRSFPFKVPSGPQTGIKVLVSPAVSVVTNLSTDLVLDFDLSRSFVVQGNPATPAGIKGFHFKPVVRAVNRSTAGSITFLVKGDNGTPANAADDAALDGAICTLTDASDALVASGVSGPKPGEDAVDGYVLLWAVPAGSYTLAVSANGYDDYRTPVTVVAANRMDLHTVTLAESPAMSGTVTTAVKPKSGADLLFPVAGATVTAGGRSAVTDAAGAYQITGLAPGVYDVTVARTGYETTPVTGKSVAPPSTETSDFVLEPLFSPVTGTVRNASNAPVAGVTVSATVQYAGEAVVVAEAVSAASGEYTLSLPTGSYQLGAGGTTAALDVVGPTPAFLDLTAP